MISVLALTLTGALIGFLRYNFNPASIFLGDSGSLLIGFTLAALSVFGAQKASTAVAVAIPLLAFGLPVVDTGFSMMRRFISGKPLFEADREHIHHMLLARGWSQRRVALILYGVCAAFGLLALLSVSDTSGRAAGLVLFVVGVVVIIAVGHLRYHEVDEIRASMKRNVVERRLRAANNIHIRRASRAVSQAKTLNELFEALTKMLELSEFVYVVVQLGRAHGEAHNERILSLEQKAGTALRRAQLRNGLINWSWERGDIEAAEVVGSGHFWTLRVPLMTQRAAWGYINFYRGFDSDTMLLDTNYLCNLFQREMARAAERLLATNAEIGNFESAQLPGLRIAGGK
ncbi:MAG: MraY family glycosyltransferase [Pyrinomonadaceae bacterium]